MTTENRSNVFGDVRAENDHAMLDSSFYEWQDYKTLLESTDRFVVVGRRGTGKSALTYKLSKDWKARKTTPIVIAPIEEEVLGLRVIAKQFGATVNRIRAGIKIAWRYALLMEIGLKLEAHYKTNQQILSSPTLVQHLRAWKLHGATPVERLRITLRELWDRKPSSSPEERISDLSRLLDLQNVSSEITSLVEEKNRRYVILIDRLDEGYEPDSVGVGIVDGLIYGTDEVRSSLQPNIKALIFLRDNIFRAIQEHDPDFSRNIEGQALRLHWDPQELFYLVASRIRKAFEIDAESDIKVWNRYVNHELSGRDGFKQCLRLTLYRPRDILALLNSAHYVAKKQGRDNLIPSDIKTSSQAISASRFDDLWKEYDHVFPGIKIIAGSFAGLSPRLTLEAATFHVSNIIGNDDADPALREHAKILGGETEVIKALAGIGFFGIIDKQTEKIIFSHDGTELARPFLSEQELIIHPCYWPALNIHSEDFDESLAQEIFDEYEISITSESKELRDKKLGQLISELGSIQTGSESAGLFEDWCKRVIDIAFSRQLTNVQLHPNKNASLRRDIVATNQGLSGFWKRVREDYKSRQVIFEVKNYEALSVDEYRQVAAYLGREYGSLGFVICRDPKKELSKGKELEAFREFYHQGKLVIKISSSILSAVLSKLRSPQKSTADIDRILEKHLDNNIRLYANGQHLNDSSAD